MIDDTVARACAMTDALALAASWPTAPHPASLDQVLSYPHPTQQRASTLQGGDPYAADGHDTVRAGREQDRKTLCSGSMYIGSYRLESLTNG